MECSNIFFHISFGYILNIIKARGIIILWILVKVFVKSEYIKHSSLALFFLGVNFKMKSVTIRIFTWRHQRPGSWICWSAGPPQYLAFLVCFVVSEMCFFGGGFRCFSVCFGWLGVVCGVLSVFFAFLDEFGCVLGGCSCRLGVWGCFMWVWMCFECVFRIF